MRLDGDFMDKLQKILIALLVGFVIFLIWYSNDKKETAYRQMEMDYNYSEGYEQGLRDGYEQGYNDGKEGWSYKY